jgi:octaprenyl-diphosphate synthase
MNDQYTHRLQKIEAVIDKWLPEKPDSSWMEMVFAFTGTGDARDIASELVSGLIRPGRDLVTRGGKRWRPLLMVLAAECIAGESGGDAALPLTPLVELAHNASLIHDDIDDNSDERRGKPEVHLIYGADTAINSGAFLYFLPLACLSSGIASLELKEKIWTVWASHMRALHLGQAMDIAWHRDFYSLPNLNEYDRMCRLKTGCLARLAAMLGVYSAGGSDETAGVFGEAAERLGVGFQILDDVKNLDTGVPGKKRGDDIIEGKKSLPVLLYLHRYPEKRGFAASCFSAARSQGINTPELEELIGALEQAGVLEEARERGKTYINESRLIFAGSYAAGIPLNKEGTALLAGLVDFLGSS